MPPQQHTDQHSTDFHHTSRDDKNSKSGSSSKKVIEIGTCAVKEIGLEKFIRRIVHELDLHLTDNVEFNLNERGLLYKWKDVFEVEKSYTQCLGISERLYQCHSYSHEPTRKSTYFILEEYNQRIASFLPAFKFFVIVFCYYDSNNAVTKVEVQYDQMSFFLHCIGLMQLHRWLASNIVTPLAIIWVRAYKATGLLHPITFMVQLALVLWFLSKQFLSC
jgi:hypothetical protein